VQTDLFQLLEQAAQPRKSKHSPMRAWYQRTRARLLAREFSKFVSVIMCNTILTESDLEQCIEHYLKMAGNR